MGYKGKKDYSLRVGDLAKAWHEWPSEDTVIGEVVRIDIGYTGECSERPTVDEIEDQRVQLVEDMRRQQETEGNFLKRTADGQKLGFLHRPTVVWVKLNPDSNAMEPEEEKEQPTPFQLTHVVKLKMQLEN